MSKSKDKILSIITNVILIAALTLLAFAGYSAFVNRNDPNNAYVLGIKPIYIKTGSMEPALLTDSIAIVKKCDISDVQKDDIIVFRKEDKLIVHRVMDKEDGYVKTKGDNNNKRRYQMDRFPHCFNWSDYSYNRHYKENFIYARRRNRQRIVR